MMRKYRKEIRRRLLHLLGYRAPASVQMSVLEQDVWADVRPVFVLSTGRCGTSWLTRMLRHSQHLHVNHTDYPELIRQGGLAYQQHPHNLEMFEEIVRACRDGYLAQAHWMGQTYVETNNRIAFLAYAVKNVYPQSRFIHLYRHPGDFIRSGLRRRWYHGAAHDEGRIIMHQDLDTWQGMGDIEKIAWLWNETNLFAQTFVAQQPNEATLTVKAESMFSDVAVSRRILEFVGVDDVSDDTIRQLLPQRVSAQREGPSVKPYIEWSESEKEQVRQFATLAPGYGYDL